MSRKYRQAGYQDSDSERNRERSRPSQAQRFTQEERIQRRSLRHATAREATEVIRCHNCGRSIENFGVIAPESACPHCATPLHCCRSCRQFDSAARWQCRAEISEAVGDKSKANRCTSYEPRIVLDATGRRSKSAQSDDPKAQFENLFKR